MTLPTLLAAALLLPCVSQAETTAERLMQATFKVFNPSSTATGFLVRDPAPGAARTNVLLVTTQHTFVHAKSDHVLLICRRKNEAGAWQRLDHKILIRQGTNTLWICHPTQDVAVLRCTLPPQAVFEALPQTALADAKTAEARGLTVGSRLFYFGYPYCTEANPVGFPLLREGVVSGYPLFPATLYPLFLISAPTFAGDSGAPVALADTEDQQPLIIGLVVARTQQNDHLKSPEWDVTFKRDIDLGSLLHAVYIRETIDLLK
ncbi:MAG: trypsin-like peptidase domain-containing protein [bacterium]